MASYQARNREPLLDRSTQAALERRTKELLGAALFVAGVLGAAILWSYNPEDPSWLTATDTPAQNWLGRFGAGLAWPLTLIVGRGAWALPLALVAWGLRFMLHRGEERALSRSLLVPIFAALASVYAATLTPAAGWAHEFGMGGLFGDMVTGALLGIVAAQATLGLKLVSLVAGLATMVFGAFVLGSDRAEMGRFLRFLGLGLVRSYAALLMLLGRGAEASALAAKAAAESARARREEARVRKAERAAFGATVQEEPPLMAPVRPATVIRVRRSEEPPVQAPVPELVELPLAPDVPAPGEDRIRSRIAAAVMRAAEPAPPAPRVEPPLRATPVLSEVAIAAAAARGVKGPVPIILDTSRPSFTEVELPEPETELERNAFAALEEQAFDEAPAAPLPRIFTPEARRVVQPAAKPPAPSKKARAELQPSLRFDEAPPAYEPPPLSLLTNPASIQRHSLSDEALEENARMLESVLDDYGVKGEIVSVRPGPVVTMYELEPAPGLKASRVIGLSDDIARSMSALSARVSTVPGRTVIGIELPNEKREKVVLREILAARDFGDSNLRLPLALGKDIAGEPIVANLAKMPHLLIAGTTGSGKSVAINTMILSLLYKLSPEECRLIMIDPKMLELSVYDGIPHLLSPVVTDPKKAVVALKWVVGEMEERYRKMSKMGVRNIEGYNGRVREALAKGETFKRTVQTGFDEETGDPIFETDEFTPKTIPYIVVIVDEMADLMMVAGKEIEACIQRLAQMARASGIHLIMATQRPSVDVITGTIKANFPTRISFQVTSKIDSRTILGEMGAEQLLGMGDMLYMAGGGRINRIHGPFVSDEEVEEIVTHLKSFGPPEYLAGVVEGPEDESAEAIDAVLGLGGGESDDALYDQAVAIVAKDRKCSTSYIQRKLGIGYNKAARLVEQMEDQGVVTPANHVGKREILVAER